MRVLHFVLAIVTVSVSIYNGVSIAARTALKSDSKDYFALRGNIANAETDSEERKGGVGGGRGGRGGRGGGQGRVYRPVAGGHGGHEGHEEEIVVDLPPGVHVGPVFGGPHGGHYTDLALVKSGQKVLSINLRAGERVDAIYLTILNPSGEETILFHGGHGGTLKTPLVLGKGEYITGMEAHEGKHNKRTRIQYVKFITNLGNSIEGGTQTKKIGTDTAPNGCQLGGFVGRSGNELDQVSAIWTSIQPAA
ncbi:hypothetical protein F444_10711 [Phytophthora nicotianae P1976]|uniref:Jacalin-type lectin domain-containing protein n=1 Tax=Phytophthora nicotianae P1976 TaxID=1317066 RepID=A0A081A378_PHYNI|nr:hypothetical protein F444_10711 [Phytophthora nicotianae P1976]